MIFGLLGGCIHVFLEPLNYITIKSLISSVDKNDAELSRLESDIDLKQAQNEYEMNTIRCDFGDDRSVSVNDRKFPVCQRSFERYIGEDVEIQCKWHTNGTAIYNESKWTLNGKAIVNSDKTKITSTRDNYIHVETLRIVFIDENDFGEYHLWISSFPPDDRTIKCHKISYMVALMSIIQTGDFVSEIYVPAGNGLIVI